MTWRDTGGGFVFETPAATIRVSFDGRGWVAKVAVGPRKLELPAREDASKAKSDGLRAARQFLITSLTQMGGAEAPCHHCEAPDLHAGLPK